jgi:hypothetical protein
VNVFERKPRLFSSCDFSYGFALLGELLFVIEHIPVLHPSGSLRSCKFAPGKLVNSKRKVTKRMPPPGARASHPLSHLRCQRVVPGQSTLPAQLSSASLKGGLVFRILRPGAPLRLAEVFGFGRVNPARTPDLVQWSPDGDSGRPVGKDECRGNPKGKPAGGALSFGYFSLGKQRKVTRPTGRNQTFNYTKRMIKVVARRKLQQESSSKPIRGIIRGLSRSYR